MERMDVARETLQRWLSKDEKAGLVHSCGLRPVEDREGRFSPRYRRLAW